jgi:exodeoxyribonuclease V alpha subunit
MSQTLHGTIERVTFHNPESGFAVLRVQTGSRSDFVTVVGTIPRVAAGEYLEAVGDWNRDRDHGLQFKAERLQTTPPHTVEGIERYLASGLIKGIGPHYARRIIEVFGDQALTVIDESPTFLQQVKGIGPRRIQLIRESWQQQKGVRDIMVFLQSHGVGTARAMRIYKTYGDRAIELVRENPYRLATDIGGIGFQSADELAQKLGLDPSSPLRAGAAARYVLQRLSNDGHCGYPETAVLQHTVQLTNIDETIIAQAVERNIAQGEIVRETWRTKQGGTDYQYREPWLYLKPLYVAEAEAASHLRVLGKGRHPLPRINTDAAVAWVQRQMDLELAPSQRDAIRAAATSKVLVVTGGPGVGKTTIVRGILQIFAAKGLACGLCAPTGRAAKRLAETTGCEAKTIHRLLEFEPLTGTFKRHSHRPLETDLLVVDEASMLDVTLAHHLLRAVPPEGCLVLVGDVDQLPSVGPGAVLADLIASKTVPVVRLTEIFRQAGRSWIVQAAHQVNRGDLPQSAPDHQGDFFFIEVNDPAAITDRIITLIRTRIPERFQLEPLRDVQILTPMNRSELGARQLNAQLQDVLNPRQSQPEIQRYGWTFRGVDKVIQTQNNYEKEVFNGDIGRILTIDVEDQELIVDYDGRRVPYDFGELDELALAYALTIHKSQGSEYPAVIIPLHTQHYMMLQRNLVYTGITRGKRLVVLVGSRKALALAVQRQEQQGRCSGLAWRLSATS